MKECDNSKIHISSNFILSISLLIMFDTLLQRPSLHCNTPLHFTQLHFTTLRHASPNYTSPHFTQHTSPNCTSLYFTTFHPTPLHYTSPHFTSSHLHFTSSLLSLSIYISYRAISPHITKLDTVQFYFTSHH